MSILAAIDPGQAGGVAVFKNGKPVLVRPMPLFVTAGGKKDVDIPTLMSYLVTFLEGDAGLARYQVDVDCVAVERQQTMPRKAGGKSEGAAGGKSEGVVSVGTGMRNYGRILGALEALRVPYVEVSAQKWQRVVLGSVKGRRALKAASVAYVQRRYPKVSLLPTPRCTKLSDGMADAVGIGEWLLRTHHDEPAETPPTA